MTETMVDPGGKRPRSSRRPLRRKITFSLAVFSILVASLEIGLRVYHFAKARIVGRVLDEELGWKTLADVSWQLHRRGYGEITFTTQKHGFRRFGDVATDKMKILVIGDSYTHGTTVNDGSTYYDHLERAAGNVEIFAYGCGGYGTLQELLIVDRYFDRIAPDLIIWQFCSNDLMNNVQELEAVSRENNRMTRPYLRSGVVEHLYPTTRPGLYGWLSRHSHLFRFVERSLASHPGIGVETLSAAEILTSAEKTELARSTMRAILARLRTRVGAIPIVAFVIGEAEADEFFAEAAREHGMLFSDEIDTAVLAAERQGERINGVPYNGHWNDRAHQIAGTRLLEVLEELELWQRGSSH